MIISKINFIFISIKGLETKATTSLFFIIYKGNFFNQLKIFLFLTFNVKSLLSKTFFKRAVHVKLASEAKGAGQGDATRK